MGSDSEEPPVDFDRTAVEKPRGNDGRTVDRPLDRGEMLGRYQVLSLVGEGAMGAVYSAYDPHLDRRVALKVVVRRDAPDPEVRPKNHQGRLMREAQALAQLGHPNVISVFDVAAVESGVYIAMEFVEGESLGDWLRGKRSPAAILEAFVQAARGLEHAHAAGIVHRDFKPDNALMGTDGRVRVIDFGIARTHAAASLEGADLDGGGGDGLASDGARRSAELELARSADGSPAQLADMVHTQAGVLIGTPAFMSPEQFLGASADARSDQFSFCVALYQALYGKRPFDGDNVVELMAEVTTEPPHPAPPIDGLHEGVGPALLRGLSREPADRFESMRALIDALAPAPFVARPGGRRLMFGLGALAALGVATAVIVPATSGAPRCEGFERHFDGVWDDARREALRESFAAQGAGGSERLEEALDTRRTEWLASRTENCRATADGEQGEDARDLRMSCLDRRRYELSVSIDVVLAAEGDGMRRASAHISDLPPIGRCDDVARLRAEAERQPSPEVADRVTEISTALAEVRARRETGDFSGAREAIESSLTEARETGYAPLIADALLRRSRVAVAQGRFVAARDDLFEAARLADRGGALETEADAWIDLVFVVGSKLRERDEGLRWLGFARAALEQLGDDPLLEGRMLYHEGLIHSASREPRLAIEALDRARACFARVFEPDHWRFAVVHGARGSALRRMGDYEAAVAEYRRALDLMRAALGPEHPGVAPLLNNLAGALRAAGELDEARDRFEEALALKRATLEVDHPSIATTLVNLGQVEHRRGHFEQATHYLDEAIGIRERTVGESHPLFASALAARAEVALDRGDAEEGLALFRRVLSLVSARGDEWEMGIAQNNVAWALLRLGRCDEGEPLARAALGMFAERRVGSGVLAFPRTVLGACFLELGRAEEAVAPLLEALEARRPRAGAQTALTRYAAGRALYESGRERTRGHALVVAASQVSEPDGAWVQTQAELWLASHEAPPEP